MKLVKKAIEKDQSGFVTLIAEDAEDMWHAYNLISKGDGLKATTIRRVVSESVTGSTEKSSVRVNLVIRVESVDFDTFAGVLRVNGRTIEENKHMKVGSYHTLDLESHRPFTLMKEEWDIISLERIQTACDVTQKAEIAAIVMQEGLANICLITENMTIIRQRVEGAIPKKRLGSVTNYEKGIARFNDQVYRAMLQHVNFQVVKVLIIASPGFVKDQFYRYLNAEALKTENRVLIDNRSKIVLVHCSSGHKQALEEVLKEPAIQNRLSDTKYAKETKILEKFYETLGNETEKAVYGYKHVVHAMEMGAIDVLLITDGLFRSSDVPTRKKYIELVEKVRSQGGKTFIFSSQHSSGEHLEQLTGVAAILTFPLHDLDEE